MNKEKALELDRKYRTLLSENGINTTLRKAMFFAQLDHESRLIPQSENLNYSASGLTKTFGKHFNTTTATQYARKPEMIANKVYANRMGNGSESSGDGWKYRGRGYIQLTGKYNYSRLSKDKGIDYVGNPNLLLNEADSMIAALWYWNTNGLNSLADKGDVKGVTKVINGGSNGLADRQSKYNEYLKVFK